MKHFFLLFTLLSTIDAIARPRQLSYEEHLKYVKELREQQQKIINKSFVEADNIFLAFVIWKSTTSEVVSGEEYYVQQYEFKKIKNIKGINPVEKYTVKHPVKRKIKITSGSQRVELNNKHLSHERFSIIYMKNNELIRATEFIDYDGLLSSKDELALIKKKVNK